MKKPNGFSLIELVISLAIFAVLIITMVPSYQSYVTRSRRSDAIKSILSVQVAEEKYRVSNNTYGSLAQVWTGTGSLEGYYTLSVSAVTASTYTITATAGAMQANDTGCTTMTLTFANGTSTQTPSSCWQ